MRNTFKVLALLLGCAPALAGEVGNYPNAAPLNGTERFLLDQGGPMGPSLNGTIGATTASTGAFTTLSASSTVSGTGFSTYLASPPAIGGTTPSTGKFYTMSFGGGTNFTVSGCGTAGSITGSASAGSFTVGTGATNCTFTVTINGATGATATHGWILNMDDTTANIHCVNSTTVSTTTAVGVCTGTVATSDLIKFTAMGY